MLLNVLSANQWYRISLLEILNLRPHSVVLNPDLHFNKIPGDPCAHLNLGSQGLLIIDMTLTEEYTDAWKQWTLQYTCVIIHWYLWIYLQIANPTLEHENIIKETQECWKVLPVQSLNIQQLECYLFWHFPSFPQMES